MILKILSKTFASVNVQLVLYGRMTANQSLCGFGRAGANARVFLLKTISVSAKTKLCFFKSRRQMHFPEISVNKLLFGMFRVILLSAKI